MASLACSHFHLIFWSASARLPAAGLFAAGRTRDLRSEPCERASRELDSKHGFCACFCLSEKGLPDTFRSGTQVSGLSEQATSKRRTYPLRVRGALTIYRSSSFGRTTWRRRE